MTSARRTRSFILSLWLCLATVFAHAVLPVGSPLMPRPGSAFSVSTTDVALGPSRRAVQGKTRKQLTAATQDVEHAGSGSDLPAVLLSATLAPASPATVSRHFARSPTAPRHQPNPAARARAPPLA